MRGQTAERVVVLQQHLVNILPIAAAAAGDEMMAVADSRSSISPSPVKKSTVPFSYTILLFRMLTTHLITGYLSRERTNKHQCRCMMLMPQAPQKMTNELRVGHGYLVLQSCPHNLCLQIYLGVFFRNIWLSYIYYFFTHFWSNNLRKKCT